MADFDVIVYENVLAKVAALADYRSRHDMAEVPDPGAFSNTRTAVHRAGRVNIEVIFHGFWISRF
jgi:hypothetical protein